MTYWGGLFPASYWDGLWDDEDVAANVVEGNGSEGVAAFGLLLEEGLEIRLAWQTSITKAYDGSERRASVLDDPRMAIAGSVVLDGSDLVSNRATLARYAATGATFLLGMPHEEVTTTADASGQTCTVGSTASLDWCVAGQRVVIISPSNVVAEGVIQSSTSTTILVYPAPGNDARKGARIMPAQAIYLDAQQGFQRYRTADGVERWRIAATAAELGYVTLGASAVLLLAPPKTNSGNLDNVYYQARQRGLAGNDIRVTQSADALSGVELIEDTTAKTVHIKFEGNVSTIDQLKTAINSSELIEMLGTWVSTAVLATADDEFASSALDGGTDDNHVTPGVGATVSTYRSSPWWDRGLDVADTAADSIQAMTETVDLGAAPFVVGEATEPDWGRQVMIASTDLSEWQWLKRFLATVKGRFKSFWLPTMRPDLSYVSTTTGSLVVSSSYGDPSAWYPLQRTDLCIVLAAGAGTQCVRITALVDNGNGTTTLTIVDQYDAPAVLGTVSMICWLDRCRFDGDEFAVQFTSGGFAMTTQARAVQQ